MGQPRLPAASRPTALVVFMLIGFCGRFWIDRIIARYLGHSSHGLFRVDSLRSSSHYSDARTSGFATLALGVILLFVFIPIHLHALYRNSSGERRLKAAWSRAACFRNFEKQAAYDYCAPMTADADLRQLQPADLGFTQRVFHLFEVIAVA